MLKQLARGIKLKYKYNLVVDRQQWIEILPGKSVNINHNVTNPEPGPVQNVDHLSR